MSTLDTEVIEYDYSRVGGSKHRFFARKGTYDKAVIAEVAQYSVLDYEKKDVLDIGANIGAATVLACQLGARSVTAVEPDSDNFSLLGLNIPVYAPKVTTICAAAVADPKIRTVSLYRAPNMKNLGTHSLWITGRRSKEEVLAVSLDKLFSLNSFSVVKIDAEGSEFDLILNGGVPDCVEQIIMEIHMNKREWREELYPKILDYFKRWECVRKPVNTGKNWATLGSWRR